MKYLLLILFILPTPSNHSEKYLSDTDSIYLCIEGSQREFIKYNPFVRLTPDGVFTKVISRKLIDSLSENINTFSFSNSSEKPGFDEMFDKYLKGPYPTKYQDPLSYLIYAPIIERIDSAAKKLYPDKSITPKYGTFYKNDIDAVRIPCNNDYVILIDVRYPAFCHQLGKVALQPFKNDLLNFSDKLPNISNNAIDDRIEADNEITINLLYTLLEFTYYNFPINDSLSVKGSLAEKLLQYWNNANEQFIIAHEYAHELLKHKNPYIEKSNAHYLQSWYNELEADKISQTILNELVINKSTDDYQAGWNKYLMMGGNFYLSTLQVYEQFRSVFDDNTELSPLTKNDSSLMVQILSSPQRFQSNLATFKTLPAFYRQRPHPPTQIRKAMLNQWLTQKTSIDIYGDNELDQREDSALSFSLSMMHALDKMHEMSKHAFHNAYTNKAVLDKEYER